jgi:hypothetical protein
MVFHSDSERQAAEREEGEASTPTRTRANPSEGWYKAHLRRWQDCQSAAQVSRASWLGLKEIHTGLFPCLYSHNDIGDALVMVHTSHSLGRFQRQLQAIQIYAFRKYWRNDWIVDCDRLLSADPAARPCCVPSLRTRSDVTSRYGGYWIGSKQHHNWPNSSA